MHTKIKKIAFLGAILSSVFGGIAQAQDGGTVNSSRGIGFGVCASSSNAVFDVSHTTSDPGANYTYVITNANDTILNITNSSTLDLSGAGTGVCKVYGFSYTGTLMSQTQIPLSALTSSTGMTSISSNNLTVYRELPDGGTVSTASGNDYIGVCAGPNAYFVADHVTNANFLSYWYIITNAQDSILGWVNSANTDTIDLSAAPAGECHIWGWSYRGLPDPVIGDHISTLNDDQCEEISSNWIDVYREDPDGGTVSTSTGATDLGVCATSPNAIFVADHVTTATHLSYWYIITNAQDSILGWVNSANTDTIDLSGAPAGECHIWGWSYRGLPDPIIGDHISTLNDDMCEEISSNWINVYRQNPDGGMVSTSTGATDLGVCATSSNAIFVADHVTTANFLSYWYIITDSNDSILGWVNSANTDTIDLSGAPAGECHIWGWSYRGLPDPIIGDHISTLNDDQCEEISSNWINVYRQIPDGGTVSTSTGATDLGVCATSSNAIFVADHVTTANFLSYWYIITDSNDSILGWVNSANTDTIDLSGAPAGECHIWGWSYRGLPDPIIGDHISTLNDDQCEEISSNWINVYRQNPDGGTVSTSTGATDLGVCATSSNAIFVADHVTTANFLSYWYIITDSNDSILGWVNSANTDTIDLSGAPAGECHIWGWSYRGLPDPIIGDHISTLNDDQCEEISSNWINVYRENPDGGTVATSTGATDLGVCASSSNAIFVANHTTAATHLSYWYIITDGNDDILGYVNSANTDTIDLSGAPAGECHIWGWSYRGLPDPIIGENISTLNDDQCEEISSNWITVYREIPEGGTIDSDMGTTVNIDVDDNIADPLVLSTTSGAENLSYWWIITDANDNILTWNNSNDTVDLEGAGAGTCHIWGWSYRGLPDPIVGEHISTLDDDQCEEISDNWITVNRTSTLGIEDNGAIDRTIEIFPNPSNGLVTVQSNSIISVEVFSLQGRLIHTTTTNTVDIQGQDAGIYIVKVLDAEGFHTARLVVQ